MAASIYVFSQRVLTELNIKGDVRNEQTSSVRVANVQTYSNTVRR